MSNDGSGEEAGQRQKTSAEAKTDTGTQDRNADRRDARSRARLLKQLFDDLDVDPSLATEIIQDLSSLLPPQHRMSRAADVEKRLTELLERDIKAPSELRAGSTGIELDVRSETAGRSQQRLAQFIGDGDEKVLQAYVANERLRGVLARQVAEHDAVRSALVAELARRYTLAEQWRYKIPKAMMPLIAVLLEAGVGRDELRTGNTLLGAVIDLVAERFRASGVTREGLLEAAENAANQFESFDPDAATVEPFEAAEERLSLLHRQLETEWRQKKDEQSEAEFRPARDLRIAGGGLDEHGRPVFRDVKDFGEALDYLHQQKGL
jgi:hypothetical protein